MSGCRSVGVVSGQSRDLVSKCRARSQRQITGGLSTGGTINRGFHLQQKKPRVGTHALGTIDSLVRVLPRLLSTADPLLRLDLRLDLRHKRVRRAEQQRCNRARVALERRSLVPLLAPPPPAASLRPVVSSVAAASCTRPARLPAPPLSPPPRLQHGAGAAEGWWAGHRRVGRIRSVRKEIRCSIS